MQGKLRNNGKPFRVKLNNGVIITLADNVYAWESTKHIVSEVEIEGQWIATAAADYLVDS